jgi:hypothetical protein
MSPVARSGLFMENESSEAAACRSIRYAQVKPMPQRDVPLWGNANRIPGSGPWPALE